MAKRKRKSKSAAANHLIDHLIDDAKDISAEPSFSSLDSSEDLFAVVHLDEDDYQAPQGIGLDAEEYAVENETAVNNIWGNLALKPEPKKFEQKKPEFFPSESAKPEAQKLDKPLQFPEPPKDEFQDLQTSKTVESSQTYEDRTVALSDYRNGIDSKAATVAVASVPSIRGKEITSEAVASAAKTSSRGSMVGFDASLAQSESLKMAQDRILNLENEIDRLRLENDELSSSADIIRTRLEEITERAKKLEKEKSEIQEQARSEGMIVKGHLDFKESENAKLKIRIDELDLRLKSDFKRIRVRERELENRLELARAEKNALVKAKDEQILNLKRKTDQLNAELDSYKSKVLELNRTIAANQDQFKRTVKALRLALTNLEVSDEAIVALKKAE